MPGLSRG